MLQRRLNDVAVATDADRSDKQSGAAGIHQTCPYKRSQFPPMIFFTSCGA